MLRIKPFPAWRPAPGNEHSVAAVPYDVVNRDEARALAKDNPDSFLHVSRADLDLPDSVDPYNDHVYDAARAAFDRLRNSNTLIQEDHPAVYLYRQSTTLLGREVSQVGLVCCCHIDDYNRDVIKKHEKTRQVKEDDRTRHVLAINANAGPVFLMHKDDPAIAAATASDLSTDPLYNFTAPDNVRHTIWRCADHTPYAAAFADHPAVYVADGHHRSASAARAGAQLAAKNPNHTGNEQYNWFQCVLFPRSALTILPYNRIIKDLNNLSPDDLLARIAAVAHVTPTPDPEPRQPFGFGLYLPGATDTPSANNWYAIELPEASIDTADPIASLDYQLLTDRILAPILGIGDVRTDNRIDFVGGIRGTQELVNLVDTGRAACAFAMRACTPDQIVAVADANQIMPPKSTWFEPKLRSGLLVHELSSSGIES